jgi:hypothetical protein
MNYGMQYFYTSIDRVLHGSYFFFIGFSLALFIGFFKRDFIFFLTGVKSFLTFIKLTGNIKKNELMEIEINVFIFWVILYLFL